MKTYFLLLLPLLFLFLVSVYSEDLETGANVRVGEISYLIAEKGTMRAGITREPALRKYYDIDVGDIFGSPGELDRKLDMVTRDLNSQQIFKEITYEVDYWFEENLFGQSELTAHIAITVEDSFSLYLLPYVLYDSNLGTVFGGNFNYNNVLGTLTNLNLQGYGGAETWRSGGTWESVPLKWFKGDFSIFCEKETTRRVDNQDRTVLEYTNLLLDMFMKIEVPLSYGWTFSLRPGINMPFHYDLVSWDSSYGRAEYDNLDPVTAGSLEWGFHYSNVFWEQNFRKGIEGSALLTWESNLDKWKPSQALDGSFSVFYRPLPFLGMGHHASAFYVLEGTREEAGLYLRGVLDHLMYGEWGLFLNNNIDIRAFSLAPYVEMHCYPLFDVGVVYDSETPFDAYDTRMTAGFGITLFPLFLQSLQLNAEIGYDLLNEGRPEIALKSELFF